jgi:phosphate transport system substrate-binding protein
MFYSKRFSLLKLGLLTSIAIPLLMATSSSQILKTNAQTSPAPTFTLPSALPSDAKVNLYGSDSMSGVTQSLSKQFETKFPGAKITSDVRGTEPALTALNAGEVDLAAVGRRLSEEETAKGLSYLPLSREKIAIVVGENNTFQGDITFEQFAKIFRGEITDWSELGGSPGPIRFVDRPETSDTRQSFSQYPVFKSAPFQTGPTAQPLSEDTTTAMIKELGSDGIGYAIASHVLNRPGIRIIPMHKTLPDDARYPFSQSRGYVYKDASNPAVQAFLANASSSEGQQVVLAALAEEATADGGVLGNNLAASGTVTPPEGTGTTTSGATTAGAAASPAQTTAEGGSGIPWLPILLGGGAAVAAGGIWAATRKGKGAATPGASGEGSGIGQPAIGLGAIATGAGAAAGAAAAGLGAGAAAARTGLEEATGVAKGAAATATGLGAGVLGAGAAAVGLGALASKTDKGRAVLVPRSEETAYAYWEISEDQKADARLQGGRTMGARLYDVTEGENAAEARLVHQVECNDQDCDRHLAIPEGDRDYVVEVGYSTADSRWLPMARSSAVHVPQSGRARSGGMGGLGLAAGGMAAAGAVTAATAIRPKTTQDSQMILVPRNSHDAYVYWEVPEDHKVELHRQGGTTPKLRLYDVTYQPNQIPSADAKPVQEVTLTEAEQDKHLHIPVSGRNYVAELGYETENGEWLRMASSSATHVPYDWAATGIGAVGHDLPTGDDVAANAASKTILEVPGSMTQVDDPRLSSASAASDTAPPVSAESKTILEVPGETVIPEPSAGTRTGADFLGVAGAGAAVAGLGAAATHPFTASADEPTIATEVHDLDEPTIATEIREPAGSSCAVQSLRVHSRNHCYPLTPVMVQEIQNKSVQTSLETGQYLIKIRSGGFGYTSGRGNYDPWIMLWVYGGRVINQQTGINVATTMSTLNGYDEVLSLQVLEPATLSAFFMDTHVEDNEGTVTLSIVKVDT